MVRFFARWFGVAAAFAVIALLVDARPALALDRYINQGPDRVVISGYDTTSYFRGGAARRGSKAHVVRYKGATWRFATAREAALFRANPTAYAPQFGAYCTGGLSQRHAVMGNARIWRIYKGKLYLFATDYGRMQLFDRDPEGTIARAQAYWRTLPIKAN